MAHFPAVKTVSVHSDRGFAPGLASCRAYGGEKAHGPSANRNIVRTQTQKHTKIHTPDRSHTYV